MTKRVYISYTSDLIDMVTATKEAISNIGLQPVLLDDHSKRSSNSMMAGMRKLIRSCDYFVGIYASRYGSVPNYDHEDKPNQFSYSYIHWEYEWANDFQLGMIPLIMRYQEPRASQREPELMAFIEHLMQRHYCTFFNDLPQDVYWATIERIAGLLVPPANSIVTVPNFEPPSKQDQYQCDLFMIMPFRDSLTQIYTDKICKVAEDLNVTIKRGDVFQSRRGYIMAEVWHAIYASKIIIVDCTIPDGEGTNGNVYYELGIADTLGKPIIFITQTMPEHLPFDIRHRRLIVYDTSKTGLNNLIVQLTSSLRTLLAEN